VTSRTKQICGAAALLAALGVSGCRSDAPAVPEDQPARTLAQSMADEPSDAVRRLTGNDNGLELHKWLVEDQPDLIASAMARYGRGDVLGPEADRRFRRNGLRFVRVALDDLSALLEALGGASVNVKGWHGQILQWRAIHELSLERHPQTLAVDGRFRRVEGGRLALLARAWTVLMEDGPHLQLELVPEYRRETRRSTDLRQLLERPDGTGASEPITTMAVDVALEAGFAYLLTYEAPQADWSESGAPAPLEDAGGPAGQGVGPEAVAPRTLGQRLLWSDAGRTGRGVLVFVPRIPRELYPPELVVSGSD
jgi:hypothetical protein